MFVLSATRRRRSTRSSRPRSRGSRRSISTRIRCADRRRAKTGRLVRCAAGGQPRAAVDNRYAARQLARSRRGAPAVVPVRQRGRRRSRRRLRAAVLDQLGIDIMFANRVAMGPACRRRGSRGKTVCVDASDVSARQRADDPPSRSPRVLPARREAAEAHYAESGVAVRPKTLAEYSTRWCGRRSRAVRRAARSPRAYEMAYLACARRRQPVAADAEKAYTRRARRRRRQRLQGAAGLHLQVHRRRVRAARHGGPPSRRARRRQLLQRRWRQSAAARSRSSTTRCCAAHFVMRARRLAVHQRDHGAATKPNAYVDLLRSRPVWAHLDTQFPPSVLRKWLAMACRRRS